MGLLNSIKLAFRANKIKKEQAEKGCVDGGGSSILGVPELVSNLRLGGFASIDLFKLKLGDFLFEGDASASRIEAYGVIDLGEGEKIHRFYLYNDTFIQFMTHNDDIIEIMLFAYDDSQSLTESFVRNFMDYPEQQFDETLNYRDTEYQCLMKELGANGREIVRPIHMVEEITKRTESDVMRYTVEHYMQLYRRDVPNTSEHEFVIREVEESDDGFMMVYAIGLNIAEKDLTIS
jgi:hypothetical protein